MMWKKDAVDCGGWDETFQRHQEAALLLRYFRNGGMIGVVPKILVGFDVSDRSNAAENAKKNEMQTLYYLDAFTDVIDACELKEHGLRRRIYIHRYRGILLSYLKEKNLNGAVGFYFRKCIKHMIAFNISMFYYIIQRYTMKNRG